MRSFMQVARMAATLIFWAATLMLWLLLAIFALLGFCFGFIIPIPDPSPAYERDPSGLFPYVLWSGDEILRRALPYTVPAV